MNKLFISLYTDEDLPQRLAIELRRRGYEAYSSHEVGMDEHPDEEQLEYAADKDYALMTVNARDFTQISKEWLIAGLHHSGIIVVHERLKNRRRFKELLRHTLVLLDTKTADEVRDQIFYLSDFS